MSVTSEQSGAIAWFSFCSIVAAVRLLHMLIKGNRHRREFSVMLDYFLMVLSILAICIVAFEYITPYLVYILCLLVYSYYRNVISTRECTLDTIEEGDEVGKYV